MKTYRTFSFLFVVLLVLLSGCGDREKENEVEVNGTIINETLMLNDFKRNYLLYIPEDYQENERYPLVLALHGGGGTREKMRQLTSRGFETLADEEGFLVVYPDALSYEEADKTPPDEGMADKNGHWNDGRDVEGYLSQEEDIDDVAYIRGIIEAVDEEYGVKQGQVFVTGISNGGLMTHRIGCEMSDEIAAIAPVSAAMAKNIVSQCTPDTAVSVMMINGDADPLVPWNGSTIHTPAGRPILGERLTVPRTMQKWLELNGCSEDVFNRTRQDRVADDTSVTITRYSQCRGEVSVLQYEINKGGHGWPGGEQGVIREVISGKTTREFAGAEVIWDFFKNSSRS